jgi:hypothetical protein
MEDVFGESGKYEYQALFEASVEPQNRDVAGPAGDHIFECYVQSGAYDDILAKLKKSSSRPRLEFTAEGTIAGVPMVGKPDLLFSIDGVDICHDWKVSGYYSQYGISPSKGYYLCRDAPVSDKPSRYHLKAHPDYSPVDYRGLTINANYLEDSNPAWAAQLVIYAWLMGEPPGSDFVLSIDEIVGRPGADRPLLRTAHYLARSSKGFQDRLLAKIQSAWYAIESGHIFTWLDRKESDEKCEVLERAAVSMHFLDSTTPKKKFSGKLC